MRPGDHYVICDRCGFKRYRSDCVKTWDNLIVCGDTCDDGPRSPLDMPESRADFQGVADARPERDDVFISDAITWDDL